MKKTYLIFFVVLFFSNISKSQDVYNVDSIRDINLIFYDADWRDSLDSYYIQRIDSMVLADLTINGTSFDSVGVRWKGNSSCSPGQIKNPIHIELDFKIDQDYFDVKTFKLSNLFKEPSYVREVAMYEFLNWYMPASKSNYVNVYIDGALLGFYVSTKSVNKDFMKDNFGSKTNARFKCDPLHFAGPPTPIPGCGPPPPSAAAALLFFSSDTACYQYSYEMKSDYGWERLLQLIETIKLDSTNAKNILNVDRTLWMLAFDNLFVNLDSYIGSGHNYYLYQNDSNKFNPIIWDINEVFGTFAEGMNPIQLRNLDLFYNTNKHERPLLSTLLTIPENRKKYLAHYRTLVKELLETDTIINRCYELQSMIDTHVQSDPNNLFTYANFQNSMTHNTGSAQGISHFLNDRYDFVTNNIDYNKTAPSIISVIPPSVEVLPTDTVIISAIVTNATYCSLAYKTGRFDPFIYLQMFDDGNHNDGAANDGVYAASIPPFPTNTQVDYFIYSKNSEAGVFLPVRAEYEFFNYIVFGEIIDVGDVVINEFMASNSITQADQDNEFNDWIELFNPTTENIKLKNAYLSDNSTDIHKWQFPDTTIQANSYLIVWADKDETQDGLHASFKLSSAGEYVILSNFDGSIIDSINYTTQTVDISLGRYPNAYGPFHILSPTFNAYNGALSVDEVNIVNNILLYPNPANESINIFSEKHLLNSVKITDITGRIIKTIHNIDNNGLNINIFDLINGVYFITINADKVYRAKFIKE
ncbi:MAG: CotH kinase family protein [Flavobacteriaceae bacterium]|nr:CotH kinase family protein [Flavobacteriaceae bacterium]